MSQSKLTIIFGFQKISNPVLVQVNLNLRLNHFQYLIVYYVDSLNSI